METETYFIRSLLVQNIIMGVTVAIVAGLLVYFIRRGSRPHAIAAGVWLLIAFLFFNSPFWGFSAVSAGSSGIRLHYGFLSVLKNIELPVNTSWKINTYMGGIRRMKKLYYFSFNERSSLKVTGAGLSSLQDLGAAVDRLNGRPMGSLVDRPVNL